MESNGRHCRRRGNPGLRGSGQGEGKWILGETGRASACAAPCRFCRALRSCPQASKDRPRPGISCGPRPQNRGVSRVEKSPPSDVVISQEGKKPGGRGPFKEGCVPRGKRKATNCFRESRHSSRVIISRHWITLQTKPSPPAQRLLFTSFSRMKVLSIRQTHAGHHSFIHSFTIKVCCELPGTVRQARGNRLDRNQRHSRHAEASTERRGDGDLPGTDREACGHRRLAQGSVAVTVTAPTREGHRQRGHEVGRSQSTRTAGVWVSS